MDYYEIFDLGSEPFSNSPDPDFFYRARQHVECLNAVEIAIRLRRGLNVVLGDIGTGKSMLCRQLIRALAEDETVRPLLILDPYFGSTEEFLRVIHSMVTGVEASTGASEWQMKEDVKNSLYKAGVEDGLTTVLILDEGQKIREECLELLREFLNYETNSHKLLQIVIFAQSEFSDILRRMPNLADRINTSVRLAPLSFRDTVAMIRFRLDRVRTGFAARDMFTWPAYWAIHRATGGYPRKIVTLCHKALLAMIIQNRSRAGYGVIAGLGRDAPVSALRRIGQAAAVLAALLALVFLFRPVLPPLAHLPWTSSPSPAVPALPTTEPAQSPPLQSAAAVQPAIPEPSAPAEPARQPEEARPPEVLGSLAVRPQELLSEMIARVYGVYDVRLLRTVLAANPHVRDANAVTSGTELRLPAIQPPADSRAGELFWLRLGDSQGNLGAAYDEVRLLRGAGVKARLLVRWSQRAGLSFEVVEAASYPTREAAAAALAGLPVAARGRAGIIGGFGQDEVLFLAAKRPVAGKG